MKKKLKLVYKKLASSDFINAFNLNLIFNKSHFMVFIIIRYVSNFDVYKIPN